MLVVLAVLVGVCRRGARAVGVAGGEGGRGIERSDGVGVGAAVLS